MWRAIDSVVSWADFKQRVRTVGCNGSEDGEEVRPVTVVIPVGHVAGVGAELVESGAVNAVHPQGSGGTSTSEKKLPTLNDGSFGIEKFDVEDA